MRRPPRTPLWIASMMALPACGAGLSGAPARAIAADSVSLPAPDRRAPGDARADALVCDRSVDVFASGQAGGLPEAWKTWRDEDLEQARRDRAFTVLRDGDQSLLRVSAAAREISLGRGVKDWDFRAYPVLEWRWRVLGVAPSAGSAPDRPLARVAAVWLTGFPFVVRRIEYTWNTGRPLAAQDSSRFGQDRSIVVASSESAAGEWHTIRVDIQRHYEAIFSKDPDAPAGIAVTAATNTRSIVDYRDFRLCRHARASAGQP